MRLRVDGSSSLVFDDGSPVRAASAIAPFGDGWLIAQDDATHAAWRRPGSVVPVRVLDPVDGLDVFSSAAGTKHLKPDFEAACQAGDGVLLLGSGSTPARMRASLVTAEGFAVVDLSPVYRRVAAVLGIAEQHLNLEGACVIGDRLRWFQRGNAAAGVPSASADVDLAALLAAFHREAAQSADRPRPDRLHAVGDAGSNVAPASVAVADARYYDLGTIGGVALAVTDAVALADGRVLVSAAAEDTPNAIDDGPVVGAALALLDDEHVLEVAELPESIKVEGLAIRGTTPDGLRLVAVVDVDDPATASQELDLYLSLTPGSGGAA
jgi:hypothetical protein